jgi:2-phosphoglycolate phosphatase
MQVRFMLPKLVLFDFDGTLADGFPGIAAAVNAVRQSRGYEPVSVEKVKQYVGWGLDHLVKNIVPGSDLEVDIPLYRQHYASTMLTGTELLPGAKTVIKSLEHKGVRLGVCSNKKRVYTEQLLERLGIMPPIEKVFGPDDVPHHKPAPDMLLAALKHFGVGKSETIYVGDMSVDIQCAHAAGVPVWAIPTGAMTAEMLSAERPTSLLHSLEEMRTLLKLS